MSVCCPAQLIYGIEPVGVEVEIRDGRRAGDSEHAERGEPFLTPHSAFADSIVSANAPPRESLEMRAICLFD